MSDIPASEMIIDLQFIESDMKDITIAREEMLQIVELDYLAMREVEAEDDEQTTDIRT
jgi:hypothetical protein